MRLKVGFQERGWEFFKVCGLAVWQLSVVFRRYGVEVDEQVGVDGV